MVLQHRLFAKPPSSWDFTLPGNAIMLRILKNFENTSQKSRSNHLRFYTEIPLPIVICTWDSFDLGQSLLVWKARTSTVLFWVLLVRVQKKQNQSSQEKDPRVHLLTHSQMSSSLYSKKNPAFMIKDFPFAKKKTSTNHSCTCLVSEKRRATPSSPSMEAKAFLQAREGISRAGSSGVWEVLVSPILHFKS